MNEPLTDKQFDLLVKSVRSSAAEKERFCESLEPRASQAGSDHLQAMKMAQGFYALCDYRRSLEWLDKAGEGRQQSYLRGKSLRMLKDYAGAIDAYAYQLLELHEPQAVAGLRVIATTDPAPFPMLVCARQQPVETVAALRTALWRIHETTEGRAILGGEQRQ